MLTALPTRADVDCWSHMRVIVVGLTADDFMHEFLHGFWHSGALLYCGMAQPGFETPLADLYQQWQALRMLMMRTLLHPFQMDAVSRCLNGLRLKIRALREDAHR